MKAKQNVQSFMILPILAVVAAAICIGCNKADDAKADADDAASQAPAKQQPQAEELPPVEPPEPAPKPTVPEVNLTEKDSATCLIKVGDEMPNAAMQDLGSGPVELHSLFGKKLSVICFWNSEHTSGLQAIQELQKYVAEPYADKGVAVIGINVGDTPQVAKQKVDLAEARFAMLVDPQSVYFKKIATGILPRVYLIDADGKVLWFDLEYSRSMRRDLQQGIDAARN